jgi:agmatine deiminase
MQTPQTLGFRQPAEWEPHAACWLAFPSHADLWLDQLEAAQAEFFALCREIARSETLNILVLDTEDEAKLKNALEDLSLEVHQILFGDIWMRDIAPIFVTNAEGKLATLDFAWNGWGHKYMLEHDDRVATNITTALNLPTFAFDWVLEGGAVEVDGEGTCLTSKQCLLNPNRNPDMTLEEIEHGLRQTLGVEKILWLEEGLVNDHTDGHIDTIARFIAPGVVMCMRSQTNDDPNHAVLESIAEQLANFTDARGRKLSVARIPSPGRILDSEGEIMPASYLNFYIANESVIVPIYGSEFDQKAVDAIAAHFPTRRTIGLSAKVILEGGGAFHCITQQQPQS